MKQKIKELVKLCMLFIIMIMIFLLLMILSYLLPKDKIKDNASYAVNDFNKEGVWYIPLLGIDSDLSHPMLLDNYTDTLIMDIAAIDANSDEDNILKKAVLNQKYRDGENPVKSYEEIFTEGKKPNGEYTRYWFGSIVILKLLLTFESYATIRYINMIFMLILLVVVILLIEKKLGTINAIAYAITFILCGIVIIPMSLQFSPVFIITLMASLSILLLSSKKSFEKMLPYAFLIIGCLTAFCDLLTCPLLTFGIPIILLMLLRNKYNNYTFKKNLLLYFKLAVIWIISYALTYLAKWIIASIILNENVITSAWKQFMFRTDASNEYNKLSTIKKNFQFYFNRIVLNLLVIFIIINFIIIIKKKYYKNTNYKNIIFFVIVGLAPYVWYIVLSNHSAIHYWMTYRIQAITMLSILSIIFSFYDKKEVLKESKNKKEQ